jgi:hypothetical protein
MARRPGLALLGLALPLRVLPLRLLLALLLGLLPPGSRPARAADGNIDWQTLELAHARIHFPRPLAPLAHKVAATLADARAALAPLFPHQPAMVHVTIDDYSDSANGWAAVLPFDQLHLNAYPPTPDSELGDHGDWVRMLVFHEYSHLLQLGDVGGLPAASHGLVGRRWLPNQVLPRALLEGIATYVETRHVGADTAVAGRGGRVDAPQFLAVLRAAVRDGTLPELAQLTGEPMVWPRGHGWYVYGSLLVDDLVRAHGHAKLAEFIALYGRRVVPWGLNNLARVVWGRSLEALWQDARARFRSRTLQEWQMLGLPAAQGLASSATENEATASESLGLTRDGEWRGRLRPGTLPSSVVVAHGPRDGLARIEEIDVAARTRRLLHVCALDCDEPLITPDGRWLIFTESRRFERLYLFRELIAVPLPNPQVSAWRPLAEPLAVRQLAGPSRVLTRRGRVRSPTLGGDGALAWVAVREGRTEVRAASLAALLAGGEVEGAVVLPALPLGETLSSPRWLAGRWTALCGVGGRRRPCGGSSAGPWPAGTQWLDQWHDTAVGPVAVAQVGDRRWAVTPEGWTRTRTGVTSATRIPHGVVTVEHGGQGLDVVLHPAPSPLTAVVPTDAPSVDLAYAPTPVASTQHDYAARGHFWPRAWYPYLLTTDAANSPTVGAAVYGHDALDLWNWRLQGQVRTDGRDAAMLAQWTLSRWEPTWTLDLALSEAHSTYLRGFRGAQTPIRRSGVRAGGAWRWPGLRQVWSFAGSVRAVHTGLADPSQLASVPFDPGGPPPVGPWRGWQMAGDGSVDWQYGERYPASLVPERAHGVGIGISTAARVAGEPLADQGRGLLSLRLDTHHHLPLGARRVLRLDGHAAWLASAPDDEPGFEVRGLQAPLGWQVFGPLTSGIVVRGADGDGGVLLGGRAALWGTLDVVWPLADIGWGLDALPLFARRLAVVPFADGAWAFDGSVAAPSSTPQPHGGALFSLGAELRLDYEAGWLTQGLLRVGFAHAWGVGGGNAAYIGLGL